MNPNVTDVHQTLRYSAHKMHLKFLGLGLLCLGLGIFIAYTSRLRGYDFLMLVLTLALGGGMTFYALFRTLFPGKPLLAMSPEGLRLHIPWVKDVLIPWREVQGVDTVEITGHIRGSEVTFRDVTVVLVTRRFYDRHIHVNSWLLRGPGWDTNFVPEGPHVQVALHHELLPATALELRTAVELRWKAFGAPAPHERGP